MYSHIIDVDDELWHIIKDGVSFPIVLKEWLLIGRACLMLKERPT